ncbi:hypothetical protein NMG60_11014934 [Bertholletia excelsa]
MDSKQKSELSTVESEQTEARNEQTRVKQNSQSSSMDSEQQFGITAESEQPDAQNEGTQATQNGQSSSMDNDYVKKCLLLEIAATRGDWEKARGIINEGPERLKKSITWTGETALHLAAASGHTLFIEKWLEHDKIGEEDVAHPNYNEVTALGFAAATGTELVAKDILSHSKGKRCKPVEFMPLYMAASEGHGDMTNYLFKESEFHSWDHEKQITLLNTCIRSGIYNRSLLIIQQEEFGNLAYQKDEYGETPLDVLARKPSAFDDATQRSSRVINCVRKREKKVQNETAGHRLFKFCWDHYLQRAKSMDEIISYGSQLLFDAAYFGNFEFLVELLNSCPELIYKATNRETIFHIAICNRDEDTFNLIHEIGALKNLITSYRENTGKKNNILHKAALLPAKNRVKPAWGTALRVRQEILWQ